MDVTDRIDASEALARLRAGNERFVAEVRSPDGSHTTPRQRMILPAEQTPFAVILGCSDARVPAEIVFDQGLGDLFVIRVAGNVVAPSQIGSIEFAVSAFGTALVLVLGHSRCGAVEATLNELLQPGGQALSNLSAIVNRIRPAVEPLLETEMKRDPPVLLEHAVRANIRVAAHQLRHGSQFIEDQVNDGSVRIVGAEYSIETGVVNFFDGV